MITIDSIEVTCGDPVGAAFCNRAPLSKIEGYYTASRKSDILRADKPIRFRLENCSQRCQSLALTGRAVALSWHRLAPDGPFTGRYTTVGPFVARATIETSPGGGSELASIC